MNDITFREIKDLGYQIDEDIHNVAQFYKVNLNSDTKISEFSHKIIETDIIETNYEISDTTYSITKNNLIIDTGLTEEEIIDFFTSGEYKLF